MKQKEKADRPAKPVAAWIRRCCRREPLPPGQRKKRRIYRLAALTAAVLVVALALIFFDNSDSSRYAAYLQRATAAYQAGEYDSALSDLRRAAEIDGNSECLMLMVDCYEAQGNLDLALEVLRQMDISDSSVANRIAAIEQRRMQQGEAELLSVAGIQVPPDINNLVLDGVGLTDASLAEIRQLRALDTLSLQSNSLRDISQLSALGGLSSLNLSGNQITDLSPLAKLTGLRSLYLDGNPASDLSPLYELQGLRTLSILDVGVSDEQLAALTEALPGCAIHTNTAAEDVTDITLGGVTFKSDVTSLHLNGLGIRDISALAACRDLKSLDLSDNAISDLQPLMNLAGLEQLDVSGNEIADLLPLMGMSTLRSLNASDNQVADTAAVGAMTGLTTLNLSGNPIATFSGLKKLLNLRTLRLAGVGIADGDLAYLEPLSYLTVLELDGNPGLSDESMGRLHSALPGCAISHSDLVYTVELADRSFSSDTTELKLSGQGMDNLSGLERLSCLETVDLSNNCLTNILLLQYSPSRDSIRVLDLSHNEINDLSALSSLTAIEELDLSANCFRSVQPLRRLTTLRRLVLSGNELTEQQLEELRTALPDCEIVF